MNTVLYGVLVAAGIALFLFAWTVMTRTPRRILVWEAGWWVYGMYLVGHRDGVMQWIGVVIVALSTVLAATVLAPAGVLCRFRGHRPARVITVDGVYATMPQGLGLVDVNGDPVKVRCAVCERDLS